MPNHELLELAQGGVVPFRSSGEGIELCLISLTTQLGTQTAWGFPKGMVDPPESTQQAALREAYEEAGVRGELIGEALGGYSYYKREYKLNVTMFLMQVHTVDQRWPEKRVRQRRFCSPAEARALLVVPEQLQLLELALTRLGATHR